MQKSHSTDVALKHFETAPMNPLVWRVSAFTLGGMFTDGYILGHIGIALAIATPFLELNGLWLGLLAASTLVGILIGAPIAGRLSDKFGRSKLLAIDFALIAVLALLHLFVNDAGTLLLLRTLMGVVIGAEYAIGAAMLSEFAPLRHRGALLASLNGAWIVGFVGGFLSAYMMRELGADWRVIFASAVVPAIIVFLLRIGTPDSPRWLANNGNSDQAAKIIRKYYGPEYFVEAENIQDVEQAKKVGISELFSSKYIRRTIFAGGFWACQVMPLFALTIFLPQVFESLGIQGELGAEIIVNSMLLIGAVLGVLAVNYFSRRGLVINTFAIVAIALVVLAFATVLPTWLAILVFALFVLVASAASNLEYVYPSEIFPTEIRATGMGFAAAFSRVGSAASTFLLPVALEELGNMITLLLLAGVAGIGFVISVLWAPETKGKTLEEASR